VTIERYRYSGVVLLALIVFGGCPLTRNGYLVSVRADIEPQPVESIRRAILTTGTFEGPIAVIATTLCVDARTYRTTLVKSRVSVHINDCYGTSTLSDTGWIYSVGVAAGRDGLREEVKAEMQLLAETIRGAIQQTGRFHGTYPPNFNEGTHLISRKGPTPFQVVPFDF
jgi:hypothetical protein